MRSASYGSIHFVVGHVTWHWAVQWGGLGIHLIADPHKGAHCMQRQAMILKEMTRIKTINASQRPVILGSQEVSLDKLITKNPSLCFILDTTSFTCFTLCTMSYELSVTLNSRVL